MNRIRKSLHAIRLILGNPWLLNRVLQDPCIWTEKVEKKYNMPNGLPVIGPEQIFNDNYEEEVPLFTFLDGGSLVTDILLLRSLARRFDSCSYFEIGTWRGESVFNIADIAKECYTLNLSEKEMLQMKVPQKYIALQGYFSSGLKNVVHLKGNSANFNFAGLNKKFDLIFIDGSHHYDMVKNDTEKVFQHLIHDKSVVVWHDYAINPEKVRFEVLSAILDGTPRNYHPFLYHVANTKSAVLYKEKFESRILEEPVTPKSFYQIQAKYQMIDND